jgi:ferredoxin
VRLVVDTQLCVGHGCCVDVAPQWFEMDDSGIANVLVESLDESEAGAAQAAVLSCPSEAIFLRRD